EGAVSGRCGLMDMVVESAAPEHGIRRGWFEREQAPAGVALTFECELGYTFDPAVWGPGVPRPRRRGGLAPRCATFGVGRTRSRPFSRRTSRSRRVAERSGARAA